MKGIEKMDVNIIGATTLIVKDLVNLNPQEKNIRYICQHSSKAFTDLGLNESDITAIENDMLERLDIWKDRYPERYGEKMGDDVYYVVTDGMSASQFPPEFAFLGTGKIFGAIPFYLVLIVCLFGFVSMIYAIARKPKGSKED